MTAQLILTNSSIHLLSTMYNKGDVQQHTWIKENKEFETGNFIVVQIETLHLQNQIK